jgi:hypothetical protein
MKTNLLLLQQYDRNWVDAENEPALSERARRRGIVNTFLAQRSYWAVIRWLSQGVLSGAILPQFWSFDEAALHYGAKLRVRGRLDVDQVRARYLVARYFAKAGREWL